MNNINYASAGKTVGIYVETNGVQELFLEEVTLHNKIADRILSFTPPISYEVVKKMEGLGVSTNDTLAFFSFFWEDIKEELAFNLRMNYEQ
jgi:hypothetical protein